MELQTLLAPISEASPCGEDMSFSIEFDQIADMRRQDDPTLDQGEWVTSLKVADWAGVAHSCTKLLSTRTKDLRLAMWLTEAWALTQGYQGLSQGLQLCHQLCERFWVPLHPQADGGDLEERIGNIGWLLHQMVGLVDALPLTQDRQGIAYSLRDLAAARQGQALLERHPTDATRPGTDKAVLDQVIRALKGTPAAVLLGHLNAARQCQQHLLTWQMVIDGHLAADGPSFVQAKEALSQVIHDIERLARDSGALAAEPGTQPSGPLGNEDDLVDVGSANPAQAGGPLRTRAQALQQLREVAQFFRRTEPHSPVAYLADKAVKWGDMPLHEWLRQVVKDQGAMAHLQELLGLDGPSGGDNASL